MRDIYVLVPRGTRVFIAADDHERADMELAKHPADVQDMLEVVNCDLLKTDEGD